MSVPATGGVPSAGAGEEIELPRSDDAAFGALMDALAPEPDGTAAAPADGAAAGAPAAAPGGDGAAGAGTAAAGSSAADGAGQPGADAASGSAADAAGAAGADAGGAADAAAGTGRGDLPADWTADASTVISGLGELSTRLEETTAQAYQNAALVEVQTEHAQYFEALKQHPRLLVGQQVPAIGREGMETLRDTNDAREWQDAVKSILVAEVRDRAGRRMEESSDFLSTVHASIELFQNNADLVPGTKDFDVDLANRFAEMAKPYELRVDGKLHGYSIPVQPIVNALRTQLSAERATKTAAPEATAAASGAAPTPPAAPAPTPPVDAPQAGIASKAGSGGSGAEDFSTLFGTIGLPNLQI